MNTKQQQIIDEYNKVEPRHPSLGRIAKIVKVSKSYVHQVIQAYLKEKGEKKS